MHAREWMQQTGEHATEMRSLLGEELYNQVLADMDEFAETVRLDLRVVLSELVSAVEDGLRRHAAGDPNAIASNMISATLREAKNALK